MNPYPLMSDCNRSGRQCLTSRWLALAPCLGAALALLLSVSARAADATAASLALDPGLGITTVPIWDGAAPGAKGSAPIDTPTLTIFPPQHDRNNGTAVIIAPGGAYLNLAANLEGRQVADWFAVRGITAFVLKYRLGERYLYPVPLEDAKRAIRWVRAHAKEYFIVPNRIGMIGFSAGGHLTAMTGTTGDDGNPAATDVVERASSRPDFIVLGYPWLDAMLPPHPKLIPSYEMLMHLPESQWADYAEKYSPQTHITKQTPPTFLYITTDDGLVTVEPTVDFYRTLLGTGVPAELHIFAHGSHGSGFGAGDPALDLWPMLLEQWLRGQGLLTQDPAIKADLDAARAAEKKKH